MNPKNKTTKFAISMFLMMTMITSILFGLPTSNAQTVNIYKSYVYVASGAELMGVGQQTTLVTWTADVPPDIGEIAGTVTSPSGRCGWYNMQIVVTKPDNITQTFTIPYSDPVGGGYISYIPEMVGTYYVQAVFTATWKNTTTARSYYSDAVSPICTFTVQEEPVQPWPESPVPQEYWTRPINSASRNWNVLGGNWLSGAHEQPLGAAGGTTTRFVQGQGPESAHILWSKPYYLGGIMEEGFGETGYMTGHYQGLSWSAIILNGKIWYSPRADSTKTEGILCVDLYTGETLYFLNQTMPAFGQIYNYESPNQHGGYTYLWRTSGVSIINPVGVNGTIWEMLDGYTLKSICKIANVTSGGTAVYGKDGSILRYNLVNLGTTASPSYYLQVWNTSAIPSELLGDSGTNYWQWRPGTGGRGQLLGGEYVHDGNKGFSLNVSIPNILGPRNSLLNETGTIRCVRENEYVIIGTAGRNDERGDLKGYLLAVSLKRGEEGKKLWDTTFSDPYAETSSNASIVLQTVYPEDGVFLCGNTVTLGGSKYLRYWGYDMRTGQQLWMTDQEPQMNYYSMQVNYYKGMLLTSGYGGVVIAYNITTGKQIWNYTAANIGFESPYGNYPINIFAICDGKIYTLTGEHSVTQPMWRGPNIRCINAANGEEIWKIMGFGANGGAHLTGMYMQMADGKVLGLNYFDNKIYCIGRGLSATTVTASPKVAVHGSSVLIEGTVIDQSPSGSLNINDKLDFDLNGTPAISDEDMGPWMEYLFMQQAKPENAKGVTVSLTAIDPNGNTIQIGEVTSDMNGNYGVPYTPDVPGTYQIIANFQGSKAYGPSTATTYLSVGEAPAPTPTEQPAVALPPTEMYFALSTIAIIVAIAIVLALNNPDAKKTTINTANKNQFPLFIFPNILTYSF